MSFQPDFDRPFDHENNFYLTASPARTAKMLAHYELYKKSLSLPGAIVECGVFKGASLMRFGVYRHLFETEASRKIIGFDIFGEFPDTAYEDDKSRLKKFWEEAGRESISKDGLMDALERQNISDNIELIAGDVHDTIPKYLKSHPELRISLLNLDTDVYEPAKCIMENLYERVVPGGIILLDDYAVWAGETNAVDEYLQSKNVVIRKLPFAGTPAYIVK